ncbi:hypothetical protein APSETT444_003212 [Aspergillus pseudonomiae]
MALAQEQRRMQQARQKKQGSEVIPMNNPETLEAQVNGYANCGGTQVNAENPMPYLDVGISTPHAASSFKQDDSRLQPEYFWSLFGVGIECLHTTEL